MQISAIFNSSSLRGYTSKSGNQGGGGKCGVAGACGVARRPWEASLWDACCLTYSCRIATTSSIAGDSVGGAAMSPGNCPVPPLLPLVLEETPTSWCTRIKELLVQLKSFTHSSDSNEIN